jgi:hypothetical protein
VSFQNVDHFFEEMLLRRGLAAGRDVEHEDGNEVAASLEVRDAAVDAEPRPRLSRDLQEVDAEILGDRDALALDPGEIGVIQKLRLVTTVHPSLLGPSAQGPQIMLRILTF